MRYHNNSSNAFADAKEQLNNNQFESYQGLDVKSMGRIFVGLAKSGAWGCFDEFNRLDENTLSTVSTLIQAIQSALKNKDGQVTLLGSEVFQKKQFVIVFMYLEYLNICTYKLSLKSFVIDHHRLTI